MVADWRELPGRYIKDPRLGHRLGRNYPAGEICDAYWNIRWLGTDQDGLIHNGNPWRDYALNDKDYYRIFLFGGSHVMGLGAQENQYTIASVLEQTLRRRHPHVRVANCGVGAYMSWHQLLYLSTEIIGYEPNMVIVLDGHNDYAASTWGNKGQNGNWIPNTHASLDDIVKMVQEATTPQSTFEQLRKIALASKFGTRMQKLFSGGANNKNQPKWRNTVWGISDYTKWSLKPESITWYMRNARSTIGVTRSNAAKIVYLLQPQSVEGGRQYTEYEDDLMRRIHERMPPMPLLCPKWCEMLKPSFAKFQAEQHDGKNVWVEDASRWLDTIPESVYHDWVHYNRLGQELIATRIAEIVHAMLSTSQTTSVQHQPNSH